MREREHLGCLRIRDGVITLERMYFADEIRATDELKPSRARVTKQELEMATALIDRFKGSFDPSKYSDTYTDKLLDVIKRKQKGETVTVEAGSAGGGDAGSDGGAAREYRGAWRADASDTEVAAAGFVTARRDPGSLGPLGSEEAHGQLPVEPAGLEPATSCVPRKRSPS